MIGSRPSTGSRASIRVRAALAGGLVFGIAAGLTVASWTDAEFARSTFAAGSFGIQTSVQGAAYTTSASPALAVSGLYPSATLTTGNAYVSLRVKTLATSVAGTVSLSADPNAGTGPTPVLRYRIVSTTATCDSGVFTAAATYVAGTATTYRLVSAALPATTALSITAAGGAEQPYCIEFSIVPASAQATYAGTAGTLTLNVIGSTS